MDEKLSSLKLAWAKGDYGSGELTYSKTYSKTRVPKLVSFYFKA
mgnify:CR=1 FL=1